VSSHEPSDASVNSVAIWALIAAAAFAHGDWVACSRDPSSAAFWVVGATITPGSTGTGSSHADDQGAVYFPYFDMEVIFDDSRARQLLHPSGIRCPKLSEYFPVLMDYAARARWGKISITREEAQEIAAVAR